MEQINTKIKRWGHSLAVVLPKRLLAEQSLDEGSEVTIMVRSAAVSTVGEVLTWARRHPVGLPKATDEMIRLVDRELWGTN